MVPRVRFIWRPLRPRPRQSATCASRSGDGRAPPPVEQPFGAFQWGRARVPVHASRHSAGGDRLETPKPGPLPLSDCSSRPHGAGRVRPCKLHSAPRHTRSWTPGTSHLLRAPGLWGRGVGDPPQSLHQPQSSCTVPPRVKTDPPFSGQRRIGRHGYRRTGKTRRGSRGTATDRSAMFQARP
jgi:hypothetical protein